jgi:hypothetical protein
MSTSINLFVQNLKHLARFCTCRLFVGVSVFVLNGKDAMQTIFLNLCYSNIAGACTRTLCRLEKQNLRVWIL